MRLQSTAAAPFRSDFNGHRSCTAAFKGLRLFASVSRHARSAPAPRLIWAAPRLGAVPAIDLQSRDPSIVTAAAAFTVTSRAQAHTRIQEMGALRRATVLAALVLHTTSAMILSSFDEAKLLRVDAILVLGGGAPPAPDAQLPFVAARCKAAAALWKAAAKKPKILTLSAGTAHVPQLLDARGSVVFEATASAAVIINEGVNSEDVFVETTSFDTIGNAFYSRNDHCSLAGWRRILVITSEFHLARTKAIFDWVYGAAGAEPSGAYELSYLGTAGICVEIRSSRRGRLLEHRTHWLISTHRRTRA